MGKSSATLGYFNFLRLVVNPLGTGIFKALEESLGGCEFTVAREKTGFSFYYIVTEDLGKNPKILARIILNQGGISGSISNEERMNGLKDYLVKFAKDNELRLSNLERYAGQKTGS